MRNTVAIFQRMPRDLRLYLWSWGFMGFGYFGVFAVLFNLYLLQLGYGTETIGLLVGAGQLVWGLAAIPAGIVGGRIGNRNAMIWGTAFMAAMVGLLLCVELLPASMQTGWIATCWILSWVGSSLTVVNGSPYVMAIAPVEDRRAAFAGNQVFLGFFGFLGSLAAGLLPGIVAAWTGLSAGSQTVYWYVLWLTPLSYVGAVLLLGRTAPLPPIAKVRGEVLDAKMPLLLIAFIGLVVFLQTSAEGTLRAFFNVYLDTALQAPVARIGVVMGLGQIVPVFAALAAPMVMMRRGAGGTVVLSNLVMTLFMLILAFFSSWFAASIGYIGVLLTVSLAAVARGLFSQEIVSPQWRTAMSTAFTIGLALGWASAAGLGGFVITAYGYRALFLLGAVLAATSALLLWGYLHYVARYNAATPESVRTAP